MRTILSAIAAIAKTIGSAVKKCFIGIKNILVKIFTPITHFIFLLCKGIYIVFKYFFLYVFIKPILFLYQYVVLSICRGLRYICTLFYKYVILPPLRGIGFIFKKIGRFFRLIYQKILTPIGHLIAKVFSAIVSGIHYIFSKIYLFILILSKFIFYKIIKPICHFIAFIFKKIGAGIKWFCRKTWSFFRIIFLFIYNKILYRIGYCIYGFFKYIFIGLEFILEKIWSGIYWFLNKIFRVIRCIAKFIIYKILKPICLFIYHYLLKPIGNFLKFIFTKLYHFLVWTADKIITALEIIGKWIWKAIKFTYQCISVFIVVSISSILCLLYTFLVYPIRVLIENNNVASKNEYSILKRLVFNPYYLFIVTKENNIKQVIRYKEKHPDIVIFIQIKNVVAYLPTLLYSIVFYLINYFLILIFYSKKA